MKTKAMRARVAGALILVATATTAAPDRAHAQTAPPAGKPAPAPPASAESARASAEADAAFAKGKELYGRGQLKASYEAYQTAWSLKQSYDIAANLANTELQLGLKVEAAEHLAFCLRSFPATGNKAHHERITEQFRGVRKEVGSIVVGADKEGAEVAFNVTPVGRTPLKNEVFVKPGAYVVSARLAGHETALQTLNVPAGETRVVNLELPPEPRSAAPAPPPREIVPAPGLGDGAGEVKPGPRRAVLIGGGVTAGAGVVAGVVLVLLAAGRDSDAEAQREAIVRTGGPAACGVTTPACAELRDTLQGAADLKNAALWTFVGAGAVGVATGAYALLTPGSPRAAVVAAPAVTARGGVFLIRGTW